ncbi:MAG: Uma2 family endonuclease [Isosphaeraceae bacterium]|nr:Uma2 family endonuclease [Isosphaeraceae bacterium]
MVESTLIAEPPAPAAAAAPASPAGVRRRLFTVAEFERMAEVGILAHQERVELIEGEIVQMSPVGSPHAACVNRLNALFHKGLGDRVVVIVQNPIHLGERSEPEPDVALAQPRPDFYEAGHPGPADLYLVVEVMETSAGYDRQVKLPLYARAGIAELWLVDLAGRLVEVHRRPLGGQYAEKRTVTPGQTLAPEAFPEVVFAVEAILG